MDSEATGEVALLSIRPEYAGRILSGEKKWEFRRVRFRRAVSHILVYACRPVGKVVGWAEVVRVVDADPALLWEQCSGCAGLSRPEYDGYFLGASRAVGIELGKLTVLAEPADLDQFKADRRAPQSFEYLPICLLSNSDWAEAALEVSA